MAGAGGVYLCKSTAGFATTRVGHEAITEQDPDVMAEDNSSEHDPDSEHTADILAEDDPEALLDLWALQSQHRLCDSAVDVRSSALREEELEALERHFLINDVASCFAPTFTPGSAGAQSSRRPPSDAAVFGDQADRVPPVADHAQKPLPVHSPIRDTARLAYSQDSPRRLASHARQSTGEIPPPSLTDGTRPGEPSFPNTRHHGEQSRGPKLDVSFDIPFVTLAKGGCNTPQGTEQDNKLPGQRQTLAPPGSVVANQGSLLSENPRELSQTVGGLLSRFHSNHTSQASAALQSASSDVSSRTKPCLSCIQEKKFPERDQITLSCAASCERGNNVTSTRLTQQLHLKRIQEYLETAELLLTSTLSPLWSSTHLVHSSVSDARENVRQALQELGALQSCDVSADGLLISGGVRSGSDVSGLAHFKDEVEKETQLETLPVTTPGDHIGSSGGAGIINSVIVSSKPLGDDKNEEATTAGPLTASLPRQPRQEDEESEGSSCTMTSSKVTMRTKSSLEGASISFSTETAGRPLADVVETTFEGVSCEGHLRFHGDGSISRPGSLVHLHCRDLSDVTSVVTTSEPRWRLEESSVSADVSTSADESSYYSDVDEDEELSECGRPHLGDLHGLFRRPILDLAAPDPVDDVLRQERIQRHLAALKQQSTSSALAVETVVTATGERLGNHQHARGRSRDGEHVNVGCLYPFIPKPLSVTSSGSPGFAESDQAAEDSRHRKGKITFSGTYSRLFRPDQQVALVGARQMTSGEFQESYDRTYDVTKVKRFELDSDIPWDKLRFSDTEDDERSEKAWVEPTSEDDSFERTNLTDTDSSASASDW